MDPAETQDQTMLNTRTKRDQYIFEIRKQKATEFISAKRMKFTQSLSNQQNRLDSNAETEEDQQQQVESLKVTFNQLTSDFADALQNQDFEKLYKVVKTIRIKISVHENPPLEEFINTGLFPYIVKLLDERFKDYPNLQAESLWVITNGLAGNSQQTKTLCNEELIGTLMKLISSSNQSLVESVFVILALFNFLGFLCFS